MAGRTRTNPLAASVGTIEKKTVLIVDDDSDIRYLLRVLVVGDGFEVIGEAADGADAIDLAVDTEPDFIVLDHMMPNMTGAQAADVLREMTPGSRIVAFSAILSEKPDWADAYLDKDQIGDIVPLLRAMTA